MKKLFPLLLLIFCAGAYGQKPDVSKMRSPNGEPIKIAADERLVHVLAEDNVVSVLFYYKTNTVQKIAPATYRVVFIDEELDDEGEKIDSNYEVQCVSKTLRRTAYYKYVVGSPVLEKKSADAPFLPAAADSVQHLLLKSVCGEFHKQ